MSSAADAPGPVVLRTAGLTKSFRGLVALREHAIELREGEILGVIGPNGSGKSTFFNLITGFSRPDSGAIEFRGRSIAGVGTARIVGLGIARTFQGSRLFGPLSVAENILARRRSCAIPSALSPPCCAARAIAPMRARPRPSPRACST